MASSRAELEEKLRALAQRIVGAGDANAPGVAVEVRQPVEMHELPGAKQITRTFDTVAKITVHDPDPERAANFAQAIAEALDTEWAALDIGLAQVVPGSKPHTFDALFALDDSDSELAQ